MMCIFLEIGSGEDSNRGERERESVSTSDPQDRFHEALLLCQETLSEGKKMKVAPVHQETLIPSPVQNVQIWKVCGFPDPIAETAGQMTITSGD